MHLQVVTFPKQLMRNEQNLLKNLCFKGSIDSLVPFIAVILFLFIIGEKAV